MMFLAIPPFLQCGSVAGYQATPHDDRYRGVLPDTVSQEADADAELASRALWLVEIISGTLLLPFDPLIH
jgi:hypothetical protein